MSRRFRKLFRPGKVSDEQQQELAAEVPGKTMQKRLTVYLMIPLALIVVYTIYQIFQVSVSEGDKWKSLANSQQVKSTVVSASRGTVYDSNGSVVAQSATVYNIYCDPQMFKEQRDN